MVLVQAKAAQFDSDCARDACTIKIKTSSPYIFDTEAKKGYCSKECAEMATNLKVVESSGNGKGKGTWNPKPLTELWRKPEEAIQASKVFHETVVPMILETCKKLSPTSTTKNNQLVDRTIFEQVSRLYEEIFLGKMQGGSKSQ